MNMRIVEFAVPIPGTRLWAILLACGHEFSVPVLQYRMDDGDFVPIEAPALVNCRICNGDEVISNQVVTKDEV